MSGKTKQKTKRSTGTRTPSTCELKDTTPKRSKTRKSNMSTRNMDEEGSQRFKLRPKARTPCRGRTKTIGDRTEGGGPDQKTVLKQFALATIEKGVAGLLNEFTDIVASTSTPPNKTGFDANPDKNRYKDVYCMDETRVLLKWPLGTSDDYIHANFVNVRGQKKFICTQGPTEKTVDDFWRLIWQEKCRSVVMLCRVFEEGKKKCEAYYPETPNTAMTTSSNITIKNTGIIDSEKILTISTLELSAEGETIVLKHFLWNAWPDRGVPQNIMACLRLMAQVKALTPIVVHCSAGIGRTGTIVGLDIAHQTILNGEPLQLANVVRELRAQRHGSVQADVQYIYMHRVMLGLAENKKVVTREELEPFYEQYENFLRSKGF